MSANTGAFDFRSMIREIPDFPKPGILFRDITPLLGSGPAFRACIDELCRRIAPLRPQAIAAIESRGFMFGAAVASLMNIGFVPIRKPGKLPCKTRKECYALEYGTDALEIHDDALSPGTRVVLMDDLLATGGTAGAAIKLLRSIGGDVAAAAFVIELSFLHGRERLGGIPTEVLVSFSG
jgi:adenine phosphoribosyltransferase